MARIRIWNGGARASRAPGHEFTILLLPVYETENLATRASSKGKSGRIRLPNPLKLAGFHVTVPSLPGLITFGRTEDEAVEMAQDAIRCHIDGLKKGGEEIPSESAAQLRKLRISA
jgi:antitoxin HicB